MGATKRKRAKKRLLETDGKNELSQRSRVRVNKTTRGKKSVKKSRTMKQDFGLNKDVTIHLWEDRWVTAEHRLQRMEA